MTIQTRSRNSWADQWQLSPDMQIGIIGAGPSGLTAAHFLAEAGYEHVRLLEKEGRVGGKCCSITLDGHVYELGAVLGSPGFTTIRSLMRYVDMAAGPCSNSHFYTKDGHRTGLVAWRKVPIMAWQLFGKYGWLTNGKYARIYRPGLDNIHPDLYQNFNDFARQHRLRLLPQIFQPIATGFGYGYADEVPAAYMLKYIDWPIILACALQKGLFEWPEGSQKLWQRLAEEHDVVLNVQIEKVERGETVEVQTNHGHLTFDALILACPLDNTLSFLDASLQEQALFSRIRYLDYWVLLAEVEGLPHDTGFIPAHFSAAKQGHIMIWYNRWPDTDLYTFYILSDFQKSLDVIEAICDADLRSLGAVLKRVPAVRRWRYFPHVTGQDMAAGYYEQLEALQGTNRTFYGGEIMSFSTTECSARYARSLVERFFQPVKTGKIYVQTF